MENLVSFGGAVTARINFAMQQNYVPVFRSIILTNNSDKTLKGVFLRLAFEPEFALEYESGAIDLQPAVPSEISPVEIVLKPDYLFSLTEKIAGYVRIEAVQRTPEGETILGREVRSLELLAYDQWTGVNFMPETVAAFITPNHPAVQGVLSKASLFLQKWCGDPAFTGYQTRNPNIVKQQMGAVYAALQQENIAYTVPPASFEEAQRIRLPDVVLEGKCGTCLDMAVLYCACLEAAGLNSLLVVTEGHAMAGCWLEEDTFSDSLQYDGTALTKRMASGIDEISVIECT
ncbi:transglutaminase-like domain-containing protein, partial [uncultured Ruminococcus sp.]|uniref:transglutaminase-like domain-containing protein n=1 Tax=uncultured Ruminococcus sp. TaxID=165186 RepID=UPI0025D0BB1C